MKFKHRMVEVNIYEVKKGVQGKLLRRYAQQSGDRMPLEGFTNFLFQATAKTLDEANKIN